MAMAIENENHFQLTSPPVSPSTPVACHDRGERPETLGGVVLP
jgi:hypothetical protein